MTNSYRLATEITPDDKTSAIFVICFRRSIRFCSKHPQIKDIVEKAPTLYFPNIPITKPGFFGSRCVLSLQVTVRVGLIKVQRYDFKYFVKDFSGQCDICL